MGRDTEAKRNTIYLKEETPDSGVYTAGRHSPILDAKRSDDTSIN